MWRHVVGLGSYWALHGPYMGFVGIEGLACRAADLLAAAARCPRLPGQLLVRQCFGFGFVSEIWHVLGPYGSVEQNFV